jgi:sugar lactone lactonase YvrE
MRLAPALPLALAFCLLLAGCKKPSEVGSAGDRAAPQQAEAAEALEVVAAFEDTQITGVAVSGTGRLFVNAPYWQEQPDAAVMEVLSNGTVRPYPDDRWNDWRPALASTRRFVCVQSVYVDPRNPETLWVLDPASPQFQGVVRGGAKLVRIDLATDQVANVISFSDDVAPEGSYLNDVRVDRAQRHAYITDSNLGALVVVDLATGAARRVLDDHPSTAPDSSYVLRVGGEPLTGPEGQTPLIASDGIALAPDDQYVYYHALTGRHLYRVPAQALHAALADTAQADVPGGAVEDLGPTVVTDGMIMDAAGFLYHSALERDAVVRLTPDGALDVVVQDPRLLWPDSFALGPDGALYVSSSQIHLMPQYHGGTSLRTAPYRVFRIPAERLEDRE